MLKLNEKLLITPSEFFFVIRNSVKEEARQNGFPETSVQDVREGLVYFKQIPGATGKDVRVKTSIQSYVPGKEYVAHVKSGDGEFEISYKVEEAEDEGILIEYKETSIFQGKLKKWNYSLVTWLFSLRTKKQMRTMLKNMENFVLSDRKKLSQKAKKMEEQDEMFASGKPFEEELI